MTLKKLHLGKVTLVMLILLMGILFMAGSAKAEGTVQDEPIVANNVCGGGDQQIHTSINIGCKGVGNPIVDMLFAFVRFLTAGVGIVVIGSIIVAGIQYTTSQGDPNATAKALGRVRSSAMALLLYIFAVALLNYIIPSGIFI